MRDKYVARYEAWVAGKMWRTLEPIQKLWGISDLHVEHARNYAWLDSLPPMFGNDGLIVAGDVCATLSKLRETLSMLVPKFRHVFYCVGNHELWLSASDKGCADSMDKFFALLDAATEAGAHAVPALIKPSTGGRGELLAVAPLHSWYHPGFLSEEMVVKATQWEEEMIRRYGDAKRGNSGLGNGSAPLSRNGSQRKLGEGSDGGSEGGSAPPSRNGSQSRLAEEETGAEAGGTELEWTAADEEAAEKEERMRRRAMRNHERVAHMDAMCKWPRCFDPDSIEGHDGVSKNELCVAAGSPHDPPSFP